MQTGPEYQGSEDLQCIWHCGFGLLVWLSSVMVPLSFGFFDSEVDAGH